MTYLDQTLGVLKYAYKSAAGTAFATGMIATVGFPTGRSSLLIDPDGQIIVAYPDLLTGHVRVRTICAEP